MLGRPPFWPSFLTLLGLIILCGLGTWQIQRLQWKNTIITKLETAYSGDQAAPLDPENYQKGAFLYGRISGTFMPDKAFLLGPKTYKKQIGHNLIVPLKTKKGTLLVNMGWTPWPLEELPIYHLQDQTVWFEGLARRPEWNAFTPENEPENNLWFKPDINEIASIKNLENPLPFMLYAEQASHKFDAQFPKNERWYPNNNHLQYAAFWFTMAGILLIIYFLRFIRKS